MRLTATTHQGRSDVHGTLSWLSLYLVDMGRKRVGPVLTMDVFLGDEKSTRPRLWFMAAETGTALKAFPVHRNTVPTDT